MTDTTTIQITEAQSEQLDEIAAPGQSKKGVIQELIDCYKNDETGEVDELAREVSKQLDYAQLAHKTADELEGRLR